MFELFTITGYIFLFSFIIYKAKFFNRFGIKQVWIIVFFILKVFVGIVYGYILGHGGKYLGGDDYSFFRQGSAQVYHTLFINPATYFKLVFLPCHFPPPSGLEHYSHSIAAYGNESSYFMVRFHALVRLFSFGFYDVHVVFYNFISLIGILYLVRFIKSFIHGKDLLILASLSLFPGIVFWTSGMHKEGFALAALGVMLFSMLNLLNKNFNAPNVIAFLLSLALVVMLRGFIIIVIVPGIIAFAWCYLKPSKIWLKFISIHLLYYLLLFNIHWVFNGLNILAQLSDIQQQFLQLRVTNNTLPLPKLEPDLLSLISLVPDALIHTVIRPCLWEADSPVLLVASLENIVLLLLTVVVFIFFREKKSSDNPFFFFCFFYAFSLFALVGIIVPNLGALERYKCTGMLFWIFLILYILDWNKFRKIVRVKS